MLVRINGEPRELREGLTLGELITELQLPAERLAVERNRAVVRRAHWAETLVTDGDQIEIVHFVGGGAGDSVSVMPA